MESQIKTRAGTFKAKRGQISLLTTMVLAFAARTLLAPAAWGQTTVTDCTEADLRSATVEEARSLLPVAAR